MKSGPLTSPEDPDDGDIISGETKSGSYYASDMDAFQFSAEAGCQILINRKKLG
jgi:hypothetical protein